MAQVPTSLRGLEALMLLSIAALFLGGYFSAQSLAQVGADRAYQDTYYVVAHLHYILFIGLGLAVTLAMHFLINRRTSIPVALTSASLITLITWTITANALALQSLWASGFPRRYIEFDETFAAFDRFTTLTETLTLLLGFLFLLTTGVAVIMRLRNRMHR